MHPGKSVDRVFLVIVFTLIAIGFLIFISASFGTWAKSGSKFLNLLLSQIAFGLCGGLVLMFIASRLRIVLLKKYAFWIFSLSVFTALLVFVPSLGMEHGGAKRWIDLGITTFQPGELLKIGVIIYLATWLTLYKKRIHSALFGIYPLLAVLGIAGVVFIAQRDTGSFLITVFAGSAMYLAVGAKWRDIGILLIIAIMGLGALALWRPYVLDRFKTLWHHDDLQGSGYQLKQSLIAIGSGEVTGKGFGQSIQKFNYLPEAHGDSIFAVAGEEFGFIGSTLLVLLYVLFGLRGLWISAHAEDTFGALLVVGLVVLIVSQSFINIAAILRLDILSMSPTSARAKRSAVPP